MWAYNNSAIQTLSAVLEAATGEDPVDYARTQLFEPLGMADSTLTTDAAGNALTFMGLRTTCLDLARFGYLMLHDGVWDGEQVVSSDYVEQATGRSSTELNAAYGLLWWLNREGIIATPTLATTGIDDGPGARRGQLVPDAPDDAFWALGFRNQIVAVIPSEGIVAVRMGAAPAARGAVHPGRADHGRARRGGRAMTERSEVAAAADAYVWGYPLVTMHRTCAAHGGVGRGLVAMDRLSTAADRTVVAPNNDTLYASGWYDLRTGDLTVDVGAMDPGRYWSVMLLDAYTHVAYVCRRLHGCDGAHVRVTHDPPTHPSSTSRPT